MSALSLIGSFIDRISLKDGRENTCSSAHWTNESRAARSISETQTSSVKKTSVERLREYGDFDITLGNDQ